MKRFVSTAAAVLAVLAVPAVAAAGNDNGQGGKDAVSGGGLLTPPPSQNPNAFSYSAKLGNDGVARGRIHYAAPQTSDPNYHINGDVVCVRVEGNEASIVYEDAAGTRPDRTTPGGLIYVQDNGNPEDGDPVDRQANRRLTQTQLDNYEANGCPPVTPPFGRTLILRGNIDVNDR